MCQDRKKPARVAYPNMSVFSPPCALRSWFLSSQTLWVTYGGLPSAWCPVVCFSLLRYLGPPGQRERKEGDDVAGPHSRSRHVRAFPAQAVGKPAWKRQLKSRGRRSSLGQVPCGQEKPTLRLQVVTGRKTPLTLCKIGLCWPCLSAWFHCLKSVLTRHRQSNASCLFLHQCSVLQPVTVIFVISAIPPPPLHLPRIKL